MAKNEFLPFGIADGANVLTNDEYGKLIARTNGFSSGVAKSQELNKVWRQASVIATVVAQFIAETNNQDVLDDGNLATLQKGLLSALKATVSSNVPNASLTTAGITKLSNATDSNAENIAATSKAVRQINDALNTKQDKGDYATNSALNQVNDNANSRLEKEKNGADIPDKPVFIDNLGLRNTVNQARDAVPHTRKVNGKSLSSDVNLTAGDVGALSAFGGTIISDNRILELKNVTPGSANYIYGTDSSGQARYLLGCGAGSDRVVIVNTRTDTNLIVEDKRAFIDEKEIATVSDIPKNILVKSTTGYWKCADTGMILQWGTINRADSDREWVQFPTQFPTECVNVQISLSSSFSGISTSNIQARNRTKAGFTAIMSTNETQCNWFSVGY